MPYKALATVLSRKSYCTVLEKDTLVNVNAREMVLSIHVMCIV